MPLKFNDQLPIYQQLLEYYESLLVAGDLKCGDKIASVRDCAIELGVNPNTMQKAFAAMEAKGLFRTERTSGRFVTDDEERIVQLKNEKIREIIEAYFSRMAQIGFSPEQAVAMVQTLHTHKEGGEE